MNFHNLNLSKICFYLAIVFILVGVTSTYLWYQDHINTKALDIEIKENLVSIQEEDPVDKSYINPPLNKEDIYYQYVEVPLLEVDFSKLLEENSDTVAWLQVLGTSIDYPVVQGTDNAYYLDHSFNQKKNKAGWVFSDFRNNLETLNYNSIIYGHGRLDGTMFGTLKNVLTEDWLNNKENHLIKLATPTSSTLWQIFSVYTIYKESYYITTFFNHIETYEMFLNTMKNRSIYDFSTSLNKNDKILTLSTCQDNTGNRIVVHAKLIKKGTLIP